MEVLIWKLILSEKNIIMCQIQWKTLSKRNLWNSISISTNQTDVKVVLSAVKDMNIMESTIYYKGIIIRAEERNRDMYATVDEVIKKNSRNKSITRSLSWKKDLERELWQPPWPSSRWGIATSEYRKEKDLRAKASYSRWSYYADEPFGT